MTDPGLYTGISNESYHNGNELSHSGIVKLVNWSPAHFKIETEENEAMRFGSALHSMMFEKKHFESTYIFTDRSFRSKEDRIWKEDQENNGRIIMKESDGERLREMQKSIESSHSAMELLEGDGKAEISGYWNDPNFPEINCRMRIDWLRMPSGACVDLKTTTDARPFSFVRSAYNFGYHIQTAWYLYGLTQITKKEHQDFFFIAVEKNPPFALNVYQADQEFIQLGLIECQRGLKIYSDCLKTGTWPAYQDQMLTLSLPPYIRKREMPIFYD